MDIFDVFGILFTLMVFGVSILVSFYLMVFFSHPQDKDFPLIWYSKALITFGMSIIGLYLIMPTLDIMSESNLKYLENNNELHFSFDALTLWYMIMGLIMVVVFLNVFFYNFYSNKNESGITKRLRRGFKRLFLSLGGFISIVCINFAFFGSQIKTFHFLFSSNNNFSSSEDLSSTNQILHDSDNLIKIKIPFDTTIMTSVLSTFVIIGSFCYSIFGGVGAAFIPFYFIKSYLNKPETPTPEFLTLSKKVVTEMNEALIENTKELYEIQRNIDTDSIPIEEVKMKRKILRKRVQEIKRDYLSFEETYLFFKEVEKINDSNPLSYLAFAGFGILFAGLSIIFITHTILSLFHITVVFGLPLLFFDSINVVYSQIFIIGLFLYMLFFVHFGFCNLAKLIPSVMDVHSFRLNGTWTNSFLMNNNVLLLSLLGFTGFLVRASEEYFSETDADIIFYKMVTKMTLTRFLYQIRIFDILFIFSFFGALFISLFKMDGSEILNMKVREKQAVLEEKRQKLNEMQNLK